MAVQQSDSRENFLPEIPTTRDIAGRLKQARLSLGYSVDEMSVVTGLTRQEIDDAERGIGVNPTVFARLSAATRKS